MNVSYIQDWSPETGTHYSQRVRFSRSEAMQILKFDTPGTYYPHLDFVHMMWGSPLVDDHTKDRILPYRNTFYKIDNQ